jgi:hypothetical protein
MSHTMISSMSQVPCTVEVAGCCLLGCLQLPVVRVVLTQCHGTSPWIDCCWYLARMSAHVAVCLSISPPRLHSTGC